MVRKLFLTPPALPEDEQCRGLVIPASKEWLGLFSEALSQTVYSYNYEQVNPTDLTAEETAAKAWDIYTAWLDATCGGACEMPGGGKVYRKSPTSRKLEYLEAGAWVEDEDIPPAEPRTEPTEPDRLCLAAANAEQVMHDLFDFALEMYEDGIVPAAAAVDFAASVGLAIGSVFYPPLLSILALEELAFAAFYRVFDALTEDMWDSDFTDLLVCLLQQNATEDSEDRVHFDWQAVQDQLFTRAFVGETYLLQAAQAAYIVWSIGEQGLDVAGGLTAITEHECTCGSWCFQSSDWTAWERMRGGFLSGGVGPVRRTTGNPDYGHGGVYGGNNENYAEFRLQVPSSATTITSFAVQFGDVNAVNFAFVPTLGIGLPGQSDASPSFWWPANYAVPVWQSLAGSFQFWRTEFYVAFANSASDSSGPGAAIKWQVRGTGINPFIGWPGESCSWP